MGTTSQALRSGKPQLIVPHAHDQPDNAQRVNRLGVSCVCQPRRFRSSRVAAHLRDLLGQAQYRMRAEAVGRAVREEDGAAAACDAIEDALRT
jgi:UDP:flavonoid glycosyltransferase YjiC (YdhE family)